VDLVVTILIGVAMGVMVELLLPGHTMGELLLAMLLGVAGALVAQFVGARGGWFEPSDPAAFVASAIGAIIVLVLYGLLFRRGHPRKR